MSGNSTLGQPDPLANATQQPTVEIDSARAHSRTRPRWNFGILLVAILCGGAVSIWWFQDKVEPAVDPPIPSGIQETEIIEALQKKRAEVVATPQSADAWGEYAMLLIAHLFDREAEFCFTQAAHLNPNDPRWPYTLGHIALKKDPPNAARLLRQAIATTGTGSQYRSTAKLLLAEWLLELGDIDEAASLFQQELGPPPGQPRALYGLAMVAVARHDDSTAEPLMSKLLTNEYAKKQANVHLAGIARARGDEDAAKRFESEAARLPEPIAWPDPMYDVIPTLAVGRRGRERMTFFLEQRGQYYEAVQAYLAELENERSPKALIGAGINYVRMGDFERGIPFVREAFDRDPNSPVATYNLALVLFTWAEKEADRNKGSKDARKAFEEVVVQAKRTTELKADHAQAYLYWGLALKHLGDIKSAVEPLRKGLIARPEEMELHLALGQVLAQLGNKSEAETYLENARRLDPKDPRPPQELKKLRDKK
jgi:Flp pilus assembly protein TadD